MEQIISASGIQYGVIVNSDGSLNISGTVFTNDILYTQKMENNSMGQPLYIGEANPGTNVASGLWRIRQMEYDDGNLKPPTGVIWANGSSTFDKVWNDRATYNYS